MPETETVTGMEFRSLNDKIKRIMRRSAGDSVRMGYLLSRMMEERLWDGQYNCFDEYLKTELHMDYTMANRFIGINKKYSVDGRSADIDTKWADYSQAVLIEMLSMPPELEGQITPDMSVRQVREVKRQARKKSGKAKRKTQKKADGAERETIFAEQEALQTERKFLQTERGAETLGAGNAPIQDVDTFPGQVGVEEWLASMPKELPVCGQENTQDPAKSFEELPGKEEVLVVEYRELESAEDIATSQPEKSAYGFEKTVYPEGSLLSTVGCGNKYYCFLCAQDCGIRQKQRYCRHASLGNPLGCETMGVLEGIRAEIGEECQFINNDLADHMAGSGEARPCCENCGEDCTYRCQRSCQALQNIATSQPKGTEAAGEAAESYPLENDQKEPDEDMSEITDETAEVRHILNREQKTLDDYLSAGGLPEKTVFRQNIIVEALEAMLQDMENGEQEAVQEDQESDQESPEEQPPFPALKNNTQRKEWLKSYKDWGLWYRDEHIGVDYYKYDFTNGARLIAEVYQEEATKFHDAYESCYLHLVGGPKPPLGHYGVGKWQRHEKYSRYPNGETELTEFLKEVQRNG